MRADGAIEDGPMFTCFLTLLLPEVRLSNIRRCLSTDEDLPGECEGSCCCLLGLGEILLGADTDTLLHGAFSLRVPGANRTLFLDVLDLRMEKLLLSKDPEELSSGGIANNVFNLGDRDGNELVPATSRVLE